jgi:uncharacterized membrane protein YeiH
MLAGPFHLPLVFDFLATFLLASTGAIAGLEKRYDLVGIAVLALVTGLGGALLRDGFFLQQGPPAVITDGRYLAFVLAGTAVAIIFARHFHRIRLAFTVADALALGLYGVVGAQKALAASLPFLPATLIGVVNAVGGSLIRDVLVRQEPLLFKPGEFYALAALAGCIVFVGLAGGLRLPGSLAAVVAIAVAFGIRLASVMLGWRTGALAGEEPWDGPTGG